MTVAELAAQCNALIAQRKGGWPVKIQIVEAGVTSSQDFGFSQGDPADGNLVWIWPIGEVEPPKWLP